MGGLDGGDGAGDELGGGVEVGEGDDLAGANAKRYEEECERFRKRWGEVLEAGDPYYNPNFSLDRSDFSLRVEGYSALRVQ